MSGFFVCLFVCLFVVLYLIEREQKVFSYLRQLKVAPLNEMRWVFYRVQTNGCKYKGARNVIVSYVHALL
jgi:hypothetical protein